METVLSLLVAAALFITAVVITVKELQRQKYKREIKDSFREIDLEEATRLGRLQQREREVKKMLQQAIRFTSVLQQPYLEVSVYRDKKEQCTGRITFSVEGMRPIVLVELIFTADNPECLTIGNIAGTRKIPVKEFTAATTLILGWMRKYGDEPKVSWNSTPTCVDEV